MAYMAVNHVTTGHIILKRILDITNAHFIQQIYVARV